MDGKKCPEPAGFATIMEHISTAQHKYTVTGAGGKWANDCCVALLAMALSRNILVLAERGPQYELYFGDGRQLLSKNPLPHMVFSPPAKCANNP